MRSIRRSTRKSSKSVARRATCIALLIVGFIISVPFVIDTLILGNNYHYMTFWVTFRLLGLVFGGPMFVGGLIGMFTIPGGNQSTQEIDMGRIRYAAESLSRKD